MDIPGHGNWNKINLPHRLNKVLNSKSPEGYSDRQSPDEGTTAKHSTRNNNSHFLHLIFSVSYFH